MEACCASFLWIFGQATPLGAKVSMRSQSIARNLYYVFDVGNAVLAPVQSDKKVGYAKSGKVRRDALLK